MSVIRSQCKDEAEYITALRDEFAAQSLMGILSDPTVQCEESWNIFKATIAERSYEFADAMLTARSKK